jgi:general L-amino acid transport system permease protein
MSGAAIDPRLLPARQAPRKAFSLSWSDPRFRNLVWQAVILGTVAAIVWYLVQNTTRNLEARRIATGFAFLSRTAGIPIGEHLIDYDPAINTYGRAIIIGILNTLKVAVVGVVLATLWGTLLGVARLSKNWLISRLAAVYVEVVRDIPLLLQLLFWYGVLQTLPGPRQAFHPLPGVFLSNRGIKVPAVEWEQPFWWALAALVVGAVGTVAWSRSATRKQEATGVRPPVWPVALGLLVAFPVAVWAVLGAPFDVEVPELRGFNFVGGATLSPEYGALTLGLVLYTSSYIAEIVRSGILSVPTGQWEAAGAIGLRPGTTLRKVVLPQALRVIVPPMTSQYLNLIKNSSLAVAIGYQDVVSIASTTLNQTGQAVEGIALIMLVYLVISLSISLFMNWYNTRIALVER